MRAEWIMMSGRRVVVFGPAYLDRILRVDRPLVPSGQGPPIDQSIDGDWKFGDGGIIKVTGPDGFSLDITPPPDWPGPEGEVQLQGPLRAGLSARIPLRGIAWSDDLGGMGAGFAAALGGRLISALGPETDPTSQAVSGLLARHGIRHQAIRVRDRTADWTLLITSGEFGDKLPIGFRGCHSSLDPREWAGHVQTPSNLRVVAALPNRLIEPLLKAPGARTRFLAPTMRNMTDREHPLARFADDVDLLSCNRTEWESLDDRQSVAVRVPIVAVTDGPRGIDIRFTTPPGECRRIHQPAFPRARPPRDTNRAGEAFAATFVATLLDRGWEGPSRVVEESLIRIAAARAAAAAALELDLLEFGFPTPEEVDGVLRVGRVV
jgi:sugar/nucleoside kinase (ribokinase family)